MSCTGCPPEGGADADPRTLAADYLRLARRIARDWSRSRPGLRDELESAAMRGLQKATAAYRPCRGDFGAYLGVVIENELRDLLRAIASRPVEETGKLRAVKAIPSRERPPWAEAEDREEVAALLGRLPDHLATVLRLTYLEGLGLAEVAAITGTSASTVHDRKASALATLRSLVA